MRDWLPGALAVRIQNQPVVTIEVSGGWALAAIQASGLAMPDDAELRMHGRPGHRCLPAGTPRTAGSPPG